MTFRVNNLGKKEYVTTTARHMQVTLTPYITPCDCVPEFYPYVTASFNHPQAGLVTREIERFDSRHGAVVFIPGHGVCYLTIEFNDYKQVRLEAAKMSRRTRNGLTFSFLGL